MADDSYSTESDLDGTESDLDGTEEEVEEQEALYNAIHKGDLAKVTDIIKEHPLLLR